LAAFFDILYIVLFVLGSPWFLFRMLVKGKRRPGLLERLGKVKKRSGSNLCIWIHGVSVGEVLSARTLVDKLLSRYSNLDIILSTTTRTGREVARANYPNLRIIYFPLDFSDTVRRFIKRLRPSCIVLVEMEIWPNFLDAARRLRIPVIVVNGRLSRKSVRFYRRVRLLMGRAFGSIAQFCVQTDEYRERLLQLGVADAKIRVTGSMKFDTIATRSRAQNPGLLKRRLGVDEGEKILVAGSTHAGEEAKLLAAYRNILAACPGLRLILVPRHPERFDEVAHLIENARFECMRKSSLDAGTTSAMDYERPVILVDKMGQLVDTYAAADVVFVGGSFAERVGGHNVLEPAGLGKPTLFGPHMHSQKASAEILLAEGGAVMLDSPEDLVEKVRFLLDNPAEAVEMGLRAQRTVLANQGATDRHLAIMADYLDAEVVRRRSENVQVAVTEA